MTASDHLKSWLDASGLAAGYRVQFGQWKDTAPTDKFIVIQPSGGQGGQLERRQYLRLIVLGAVNANPITTQTAAEAIISGLRAYGGSAIDMQASEARYYATEENRPFFEISIEGVLNDV